MKILIASSNWGKLRDFSGAASLFKVEFELIPNFKQLPEAVEDGATFAENARKKSEHYSRWVAQQLVLADDSGLEVEALGGAPGVHSARYAGLESGLPETVTVKTRTTTRACCASWPGWKTRRRGARFVSVISVARDGRAGGGRPGAKRRACCCARRGEMQRLRVRSIVLVCAAR